MKEFRITDKNIGKKYKDGDNNVYKIIHIENDIKLKANVIALCVEGKYKGIPESFTDNGLFFSKKKSRDDLILSEEV